MIGIFGDDHMGHQRLGRHAPLVAEALARIAELCAIETEIRGQSAETRHAVRQQKSSPLLDALKTWFDARLCAVSQKAAMAEAIR